VVSKAERLTNLVTYLLEVERPVPLRAIVERVPGYPESFDSARTQFIRDRDDLRAEGIVVERHTAGNDDTYRIDPATYHLPDLGLTEAEVLALRLAASAVRLEGADPDEALLKLGTLGAEGPAVVALPSDPRLGAVFGAVRRRSLLRFRYDGVDREVEPWGLLCRDGFWYVTGFDRTRDAQRTFRIDRVDGDVAVGEAEGSFEPPAGFDPHRDIPSQPFALSPDEPTEALVAVDAVFARRAVAEVGDDAVRERHDDGSVVLAVPVRHPGGFRSWLFGMLDHARVVGPPAMVDDVRSWLAAMAEGA
jgi:proteasome accessory factor B